MLILAGEGWHRGILGLTAGRIAQCYHRPTLVRAIEGDLCIGSGRSIFTINLHEQLDVVHEHPRPVTPEVAGSSLSPPPLMVPSVRNGGGILQTANGVWSRRGGTERPLQEAVMKRAVATLILSLSTVSLLAQSAIEIRARIIQSDSATRRRDTNFQMAATSGFSVTGVSGNYNLYGAYLTAGGAWNSTGTDMLTLTFPQPQNPSWCLGNQKPCDPLTPTLNRDPRCGDTTGVVSKTPLSSVNSWLYHNYSTGGATRIPPVPTVRAWPRQWPYDCPNTGAAGWREIISAAKINAAIPNPEPLRSPGNCSRDITSSDSLATGAADAKVVHVNGKWYMAFCETINNPQINRDANGNIVSAGWTTADLFRVLWAVSDDGKNWTIRRQLFQSTFEANDCLGGMLLTQLIIDGSHFYMLVDEIGRAGLLLFRAPVDQTQIDGFGQWQLATHDPLNANRYRWVNVTAGSFIDTTALNAFSIMPGPGYVRQGAMARVHSSSAAGSLSRFIGITNHTDSSSPFTTGWLELWSAPDLDTPFTFQSIVDTTFLKAPGGNGWEPAFTVQPGQGPASPANVGHEFDFWLIGNFFQSGQNFDGGARHVTAYRMTATLSGGIYSPRVALRTANGNYISVTAGTVSAMGTTISANTRFVIPRQGNTVSSNDAVNLVARNGNYVSAVNGGGGNATSTPNAASANETFTIVRVNGTGAIVHGDSVAFRSANGFYLTAVNGGGGGVNFSSAAINSNATFRYELAQ